MGYTLLDEDGKIYNLLLDIIFPTSRLEIWIDWLYGCICFSVLGCHGRQLCQSCVFVEIAIYLVIGGLSNGGAMRHVP